jgi:hypothetical protein
MTPCVRESQVLEMLAAGREPEQWDADLRTHVKGCETCTEVFEIAAALRAVYDSDAANASLPSAGSVWWRAELRSRREAVRAVERPLAFAQAFAAAATLAVATAFLVRIFPWFGQHLAVACLMIAVIAVAPVALYFSLSNK